MGKKFYIDLAERVGWTFVQGFAAAWMVIGTFGVEALQIGAAAGAVSVAKCLLATQVGASNTAAMLPEGPDTQLG